MYGNLQAEFARQNIKAVKGLSRALNCTERTARNKLSGITDITVNEAKKIISTYFPDMQIEYLFATDEEFK